MEVYLVRHAVAYERDRRRWPDDALRPLTAAGKRKFREAAHGLARHLPRRAQVLTSPFVRARDTAAILVKTAGFRRPVKAGELAAGTPTQATFDLLRQQKHSALVIVGHEPNLGEFLSAALAGDDARVKCDFKKGGAVCLRFARGVKAGGATLVWMLPPRVLKALD